VTLSDYLSRPLSEICDCSCHAWGLESKCNICCTDGRHYVTPLEWVEGLLAVGRGCKECRGTGQWREPVVVVGIKSSTGKCFKCGGTGRVDDAMRLAIIAGKHVAGWSADCPAETILAAVKATSIKTVRDLIKKAEG